jgi:hypothetical protein
MMHGKPAPVWQWINLVGLDAPIVAVVWQDFLARCYPSMLRPAGRWTLGLTVWAIYLADRLLDVRMAPRGKETLPHQFCRRNRGAAEALLVAILVADLLVAMLWSRRAVFANGLVVSAGVVAYFGVFPVGRLTVAWKPLATALLFTTGVFLVAWTGIPEPGRTLAAPAAAFCLLCLSNLVLIGSWERHDSPALVWVCLTVLACLCVAAGFSRWYAAVASSSAGLACLAFLRDSLPHSARRVLADAVLLSPLLFVWTRTS